MKIIIRIMLMIALLMAGFAAGYPLGQRKGFSTGSEWALVQANIFAREAGLFMPVKIEAGKFRVMMKQPKHLYRTAWILADRYEDELSYMSNGNRVISEGMGPKRNAYLPDESLALPRTGQSGFAMIAISLKQQQRTRVHRDQ